MGFSNTSRTQFRYAVETTQNTVPAIAFQNITAKSGSLEANQSYVVSQGIRTDRTVPDHILANRVPGGNLVVEANYGATDPILAATLQDVNTWNQPTNYNTVAVSTASSVFQYTMTAGTSAVVINQLVYASGFTTSANNGISLVTSQTSNYVTVSSTNTLVTEASSLSKTLKVIGVQASSAGEIQATSSGLTSATTNFLNMPLVVNQVIKVGGGSSNYKFATSANNDFARVTAISSYGLTLDNLPSGWGADAAAGVTLRLCWGDYIKNGITRTSITLEEDHPDINFTRDFSGMYPDSLSRKMTPGQIIEDTYTFKGMSVTTGTSSATTGSPLAANSNSIFNAVSSIVRINEAGVQAGKMSDGTLMIKNNLGDVPALGVLGNADVRDGQFNVEFDFSMYMSSTQGQSIYTKHLADTASNIWFALKDTSSNAYTFDLPSGKFTQATTPVPGINQDYKGTYKFSSRYDTTSTYQMVVNRIPYYGQ